MEPSLHRRDFHRLGGAALAGLMAGSLAGCGGDQTPPAPNNNAGTATPPAVDSTAMANFLLEDVHVCRGLNVCKGKGKGGDNDCAGQGACATFDATCGGRNTCKGLGGCGETPGFNECAGHGGCHVPLMDGAWKKAREVFEARMKQDGKEFGAAPAKTAAKAPAAEGEEAAPAETSGDPATPDDPAGDVPDPLEDGVIEKE